MYEYEGIRRITYGDDAVFVPVCAKCGRFVKEDKFVLVNNESGLAKQPNATCSKCGRTEMIFEGFVGEAQK
jgi:ribosomal protein L32